MADLIDRETVRLAYEKSLENDNHKIAGASAIHMQEHRHMLRILDKIPAVDPESLRPQGEWSVGYYNYEGVYVRDCSYCGYAHDDLSPYCPSCGAKMKGAENNA